MKFLSGRRKAPFTDRIASRFAFWVINGHPPPDQPALDQLERERRRHLQWLLVQLAIYASFGGFLSMAAPDAAVVIAPVVLLLAAPTIWRLGRDWRATPALFEAVDHEHELVREVERACERSEHVARYRKRLGKMKRPLLRIEAVAMVAVPDLDEQHWRLEEQAPDAS